MELVTPLENILDRKISDEEVLRRTGSEREQRVKIRANQVRFVGHVLRWKKDKGPNLNRNKPR